MKNEIPSGNKEINDISYRIEKSEEKPVINEKNAKNILNTNENYQNNNLKKKNFLKYIIIILLCAIVLAIIGIIIYFVLRSLKNGENPGNDEINENKNEKENDDGKKDDDGKKGDDEKKDDDKGKEDEKNKEIQYDDFKEYSFTATYKSKDGKSFKIFNPSRLGLKKGDYSIYETSEYSNLRRIDEIEEDNGLLNSTKDGYTTIKVNFTNPLTNLDFMFEGCEDLISVNFSQINSSLDSMIYTFTNCKNLQQVDFSSIDTSNVSTMDFLFAGCDNLVELTNFESLNVSSVRKTAGMFVDCTKLLSANLSAFDMDNVDEPSGMFINNPSLRVVDLGNCSDANQLFSTESNFNLTIISSSDYSIINESFFIGNISINKEFNFNLFGGGIYCDIGDGSLCKECDDRPGYTRSCKSCNKGYYLPKINGILPTHCDECVEGCNECYLEEESNFINCTSCDEGYKLFNGKCIKDCNIGENEKCLECKTEIGENNQCLNCNEGYYLDINYNKEECKKIEIDNCIEVILESNNLKCVNCSLGFMLYNNECIEACDIGDNEKCASCKSIYEQKEFCDSCNSGYYLDNEIDPTRCQSCEIENCKNCKKISGNITCISCKEGFTLFNETCFKSCDKNCEQCYFDGINDGICLKCKETYFLKENYILIDHLYEKEKNCSKCPEGCSNCFDFYVGNDKISLNCSTCINGYKISNYICEKQCDVGEENLCLTCNDTIKNRCATCNLGYYLDINNGTCISCEVDNCIKCQLSGVCLECIEQYEPLNGKCFKTCQKGENEKCHKCNNTLLEITENCFDCNEGYYLPEDSQDKTKCSSCRLGCLHCYGKMNESICYQCQEGFQLYNNECTKDCILGAGELCYSCDLGDNGLYCGSCNEGYYLPYNLTERKRCKKCGLNMINCHQDENNNIVPDQCYYPFVPSGNYCMKPCITGYETFCDSCSQIPGEIDKCEKCLQGYYFPIDYYEKKFCYYCGSGCRNCTGNFSNIICTECWSNYMLYEGRCIKNCYIYNNGYYCASCNPEPGKNDRCLTCNDGYYLPTYSTDIYNFNRYCKKCPSLCKKCSGDYNNPLCTECLSNYYHLKDGKCLRNCKYLTSLTNCNEDSCYESEEIETFANCTKCNEGYYLPKIRDFDEEYYTCYKCSMPGCIRCEGDSKEKNICLECHNNSEPLIVNGTIISCYQECEIGEGGKCKSCKDGRDICGECNEEYILLNNRCVLEYHIFAKYKTTYRNQYIYLMNYNEISKLKINDTIISQPSNYQYFENPGEHNVYIKLREIDVFSHLFTDITNLIYIEFSDNFDSSQIYYMNDCFSGCINLISIDMSRLDLSKNRCFMNFFKNNKNLIDVKFPLKEMHNIYYFYSMFEGCEKLKYIDMSNIYNDNGGTYYKMFYGCKNLETLVLTEFYKSYSGPSKYDLFYEVPKNVTIYINQGFYNSIQNQLEDFENVYVYN